MKTMLFCATSQGDERQEGQEAEERDKLKNLAKPRNMRLATSDVLDPQAMRKRKCSRTR